jgi:hypothetical protein
MSNLIPEAMDRAQLAALLRDMAERVEAGDSFEGNLQYLMPDDPDEWPDGLPDGFPDPTADFWVTGGYRIGNLQGQGGFRMIGVPQPMPAQS